MEALYVQKRKITVFDAFARNVPYRKMRKEQRAIATEHYESSFLARCFRALKGHYMANKTIRNDRILWQAHTSSSAFFSVGVTLSS
jgi:hypothetical protein